MAIVLTGCASAGKEISTAQATQFEKGKTTKDQIIDTLGQPTGQSIMSDGRQSISYTFSKVQTRPETFIPLIGAFVGGADLRSSNVTYIFSQNGVLESFSQSSNTTGSGTGINAGAYEQPNRDLPSPDHKK